MAGQSRTKFPVIDGSVRTYEDAPTDSMHIPSRAKNKADAKTFLAFLARADIQGLIADASGMLPTNNQSPTPTDEFLKIIRYVIKDTNIFVISHKPEMHEKFESMIRFEKIKGFSRMVEG